MTQDHYPAPEGNFIARAPMLARFHVGIGLGLVCIVGAFMPWPANVLISVVTASSITDLWVHKFFH